MAATTSEELAFRINDSIREMLSQLQELCDQRGTTPGIKTEEKIAEVVSDFWANYGSAFSSTGQKIGGFYFAGRMEESQEDPDVIVDAEWRFQSNDLNKVIIDVATLTLEHLITSKVKLFINS